MNKLFQYVTPDRPILQRLWYENAAVYFVRVMQASVQLRNLQKTVLDFFFFKSHFSSCHLSGMV